MSRIETNRLVLRRPVPGDIDAFMAYAGSQRFRDERGAQTTPWKWSYFAGLIGHWEMRGFGRFVVEDRATGALIGHMGPLFPEGWPEREIAWCLWTDAVEGTGRAFEGASAILRHVFAELGWTTAVSYILADNTRSRSLANRLGATPDPAAESLPYDPAPMVYRHDRTRWLT